MNNQQTTNKQAHCSTSPLPLFGHRLLHLGNADAQVNAVALWVEVYNGFTHAAP